MWGTDWKFRHEGNCSASRGSSSDAEQLPEWRNFQFAPSNHYGFLFLHTLPSTIAFRLEHVLFYQFYAKITTFFDQERFGMAPLLYVDVETFGETDMKITSRHQKWRQNVKIVILTSCTRVVFHPSCKTTFLAPVGFTEIPVDYARNSIFKPTIWLFSHEIKKNLLFLGMIANLLYHGFTAESIHYVNINTYFYLHHPEWVCRGCSNPALSPNYFFFMGNFKKSWVNWSNRNSL